MYTYFSYLIRRRKRDDIETENTEKKCCAYFLILGNGIRCMYIYSTHRIFCLFTDFFSFSIFQQQQRISIFGTHLIEPIELNVIILV